VVKESIRELSITGNPGFVLSGPMSVGRPSRSSLFNYKVEITNISLKDGKLSSDAYTICGLVCLLLFILFCDHHQYCEFPRAALTNSHKLGSLKQ
jgi:hypothetical protein